MEFPPEPLWALLMMRIGIAVGAIGAVAIVLVLRLIRGARDRASLERLTKSVIARTVEVAEEAELRQVADDPEHTTRPSAGPWLTFVCLTMVEHGFVTGRKSKHRSVVCPDPARRAGR